MTASVTPISSVAPSCCAAGDWSGNEPDVVRRCLEAIKRADAVFAWLESDAYGTCIELGYAKAIGKPIFIRYDQNNPPTNLWFATWLGHACGTERDPASALAYIIERFVTPASDVAKLESPIERALFAELPPERSGFVRRAQLEVLGGRYRLDIAYTHEDGRKIAVECDGHDFHSSKEQRQRDARRDRDLDADGWRVLRFTGSEIHRNAAGCAQQIIKALDR